MYGVSSAAPSAYELLTSLGLRRINNSYIFIKRFSNDVKLPILSSIAFISESIFDTVFNNYFYICHEC